MEKLFFEKIEPLANIFCQLCIFLAGMSQNEAMIHLILYQDNDPKKPFTAMMNGVFWSGRPDSNWRPHAPQTCTLTNCATSRFFKPSTSRKAMPNSFKQCRDTASIIQIECKGSANFRQYKIKARFSCFFSSLIRNFAPTNGYKITKLVIYEEFFCHIVLGMRHDVHGVH